MSFQTNSTGSERQKRVKPSATIDLHGYTKEQGIRELTFFLERQSRPKNAASKSNPWVCVITGTGAHSGATGGPVLKSAVQKLLDKRHMEYFSQNKGCFMVKADSGIELKANPTREELQLAALNGDTAAGLQEPLFEDSKVRLVRATLPQSQLPHQAVKPMGKKARKALQQQQLSNTIGLSAATAEDSVPTLSELAQEEKLLEEAKSHSLKDTRKWKSQRDKEEHAIQEILRRTEKEAQEEKEREEEELRKAMELSKQAKVKEQCVQTHNEDEFERALRLSMYEAQPPVMAGEEEEEELLQKVISQSNLEHMQQKKEEEDELERVLRMSMVETKISASSSSSEDDEELQRTLRLSMVETSASTWQEDNAFVELDLQDQLQQQQQQREGVEDVEGETLQWNDSKPRAHTAVLPDAAASEQQQLAGYTSSEKFPAFNGFRYDADGGDGVMNTNNQQAGGAAGLPLPAVTTTPQILDRAQVPSSMSTTASMYPLTATQELPTGEALIESILYNNNRS